MPSLADLQIRVARAVVTGDVEPVAAALAGGPDPRKRLGIHARHYETSLTAALRDKFPAAAWLAGADLVASAARAYVHARPPRRPCIAEYGGDFPEFLASYGRAAALPYLQSFAELERAVAEVSIAIDLPPLTWPEIASLGPERLLDLSLVMQPGLRYLRSAWGVDELLTLYLENSAPEAFVLPKTDAFVEIRGARGALRMTRLDPATFAFRAALCAGRSIAAAAEGALTCDEAFDAGAALQQLTQSGLATQMAGVLEGGSP
jgi:hypothetical protein